MTSYYIHKGLLWKEWIQNRGYIFIAFLVMSFSTFVPAIYTWFKQSGGAYYIPATEWSTTIQAMLSDETFHGLSTMESWGVMVVALLGIILLGEERKNSLDYLLSLPVSRREIIISKFILGAVAIISIMLINAAFMMICEQLLPALYTSKQVVLWTCMTGSVFLCLFSLAFMVSTFTGSIIYSGIFTMIIYGLPIMLIGLLGALLQNLSIGSQALLIRLQYLASYFSIGDYINGRSHIHSIEYYNNVQPLLGVSHSISSSGKLPHNYPLEISFLLGAAVLFFMLAVIVFEKNPAERKEQVLILGNANSKHIVQIFLAVYFGFAYAASKAYSIASALAIFIISAVLVYLFIAFIYFLQGYFGIGKGKAG